MNHLVPCSDNEKQTLPKTAVFALPHSIALQRIRTMRMAMTEHGVHIGHFLRHRIDAGRSTGLPISADGGLCLECFVAQRKPSTAKNAY